jgi:glutathione peroxidase
LWTRYHARGLMIVGCAVETIFGAQEPGGAAEIEQTAHQGYGVPSRSPPRPRCAAPASIRSTNGPRRKSRSSCRAGISTSTLIGRDGHVAASFATQGRADRPRVIAAIEKELGRAA